MTRNPLQRFYGRGDLHFLTFSCYRRMPLLATASARDSFVHTLGAVRSRYHFRLIGYVVMPEHVHLLITEPRRGTPSTVLQALKQTTSRIQTRTHANPVPARSSANVHSKTKKRSPFWQRRFYDFNVWNARKVTEKLDYMHANPVMRKLVSHPKDWPWSSWSHYAHAGPGLISIDIIDKVKTPRENPHP